MPYPFQALWQEYQTLGSQRDLADWLARVLETARTNVMSVPFCVRVSSDIRQLTTSEGGTVDELLHACSEVLTKHHHEQIPLYRELEVQLKQWLQSS